MNKKTLLVSIMFVGSLMASDDGVFLGVVQERGVVVENCEQCDANVVQSDDLVSKLKDLLQSSLHIKDCSVIEENSKYLHQKIMKKISKMREKTKKMKQVLEWSDEFEVPYEELKKSYSGTCIVFASRWVENFNENNIARSNASVYRYYKTHKNDEPSSDFLYVVMRLLIWNRLENADNIVPYVHSVVTNVTIDSDSKANGMEIYKWLCENDECTLGEFCA